MRPRLASKKSHITKAAADGTLCSPTGCGASSHSLLRTLRGWGIIIQETVISCNTNNGQYLPDRFMFCMAGSRVVSYFFLIPSSFTPINPHIWPISSAIQPCQSTADFFFFQNQGTLQTQCLSCRGPVPPKP